MYPDLTQQKRLLPLKELIANNFTAEHWNDIGVLTGCIDLVRNHHRLLRSLSWDDPDYPGNVLEVLISIISRDNANFDIVENYVSERFEPEGISVSSVDAGPRIYFTPSVFSAPSGGVDPKLVSVMMPFDSGMKPVYDAIKGAAGPLGLTCKRVDDIWEHSTVIQDIFSLIFRSSIVICDFTGRNPNVFYECGIAHTLGKHVVPIAQHETDVPFDLRQHRYYRYLNNAQGLSNLTRSLSGRLATLVGQELSSFSWPGSS